MERLSTAARRALAATRWMIAAIFLSTNVAAADLQVAPVRLQFAVSDMSQAIWLANSGDRPVRAQVRIQHWLQSHGAERLEPTSDVVASPAALEIAPGQRQMVRIVRVSRERFQTERSFRLLIDELPGSADSAQPEKEGAREAQSLRFLLRYSIPMFIEPDGERPEAVGYAPQLTARWASEVDNVLELANKSIRRIRVSRMLHEDRAGARAVIVEGLVAYVLAGQTLKVQLPPTVRDVRGGRLLARIDDEQTERVIWIGDEAGAR